MDDIKTQLQKTKNDVVRIKDEKTAEYQQKLNALAT